MKGRVIAVDHGGDRPVSAALVVDGRLEDIAPARSPGGQRPEIGDVAAVRVTRVLPGGKGAFCETPWGDGFLRQGRGVVAGGRMLAQVRSLPEAGKAVTLDQKLLFRGPRVILTPSAPGVNVSRKIGNTAERARLEAAAAAALDRARDDWRLLDSAGLIVRTGARGAGEEVLAAELACLAGDAAMATSLLADEAAGTAVAGAGAGPRIPPDWLSPAPDAILASPAAAAALREAGPGQGPRRLWGDDSLAARITEEPDPLAALGVAEMLDALRRRDVSLGPGTMTVEATRALVAVDVDTGADHSPAAGLKANLAAAGELPRQLRLRGLGGQVVVDFAPMPKRDRKRLEERLGKAFRADPVETALVGWTTLGLFEMQRQRARWPLSEVC